jgi:hypothetical protein
MKLKCNCCGQIEYNPFAPGDTCWCGGVFIRQWNKISWLIYIKIHKYLLFISIVGRIYEPKSIGIPDQYRAKDRISIKLAWEIAGDIWNFKKDWEI